MFNNRERAADLVGLSPTMSDSEALGKLVIERRDFEAGGNLLCIDFSTPDKIFGDYRRSKHFESIYQELRGRTSLPVTDEGFNSIRKHFYGRILEDIGYAYIRGKADLTRQTVLPPEDVLDYFHWLYPRAAHIKDFFGHSSLKGIAVPDALVVQDTNLGPRVKFTVEMTNRTEQTQEYVDAKLLAQEIRNHAFPTVFGSTEVLLVVPENYTGGPVQERGLQLRRLPIASGRIRSEVDWIFEEYRPGDPDSATILDFQREARMQRARALGLRNDGQLTSENRAYLDGQLTPEYAAYLERLKAIA